MPQSFIQIVSQSSETFGSVCDGGGRRGAVRGCGLRRAGWEGVGLESIHSSLCWDKITRVGCREVVLPPAERSATIDPPSAILNYRPPPPLQITSAPRIPDPLLYSSLSLPKPKRV